MNRKLAYGGLIPFVGWRRPVCSIHSAAYLPLPLAMPHIDAGSWRPCLTSTVRKWPACLFTIRALASRLQRCAPSSNSPGLLDHATIFTADLETARSFFCDVVGLTEGPRPPFGARGHWLCVRGCAVIHLVSSSAQGSAGSTSPHIDHAAFRMDDPCEWEACVVVEFATISRTTALGNSGS